jgi:8-amino-7-oxononanoate synthase
MDPLPAGPSDAIDGTPSLRTPSLFDKCDGFTKADELKACGLYPYMRVIESGQDTEVQVDGRRMLMLGSNSYLELTTHPHVKERAIQAIRQYGTGCAGSRFLNGTLPIHLELERRLAALVGKEAALVFPTGFQTNTGVVASLLHQGEFVVVDKYIHACVLDGCALSQGTLVRYNHNDMADLEDKLARLPAAANKLIITDGIFSMEGDLCDLPRITGLARAYGAQLMVDDAHGIGVLGKTGRGTAEHFGLEKDVDIIMGTYSKSLASIGGFVAASEDVIHYMKHTSRPLIFSASPPPASVASVIAALDVIDQEPDRRERLWHNTHKMMKAFNQMGFDTGTTETPIIPLLMGEMEKAFMMWKVLSDEGVFVNPVVPPATQPGRSLIRTSYMATHTDEQLDRVLVILEKAGKKLGVIK